MNTGPWPFLDNAAAPPPGHACEGVPPELRLTPYKDKCPDDAQGNHVTPHHIIPDRLMKSWTGKPNSSYHGKSPCVCVAGKTQYKEVHAKCHEFVDPIERVYAEDGAPYDYQRARFAAALSCANALDPERELTDKEVECVEAQLDNFYKDDPNGPGLTDTSPLHSTSAKTGKNNDLYEMVKDKLD